MSHWPRAGRPTESIALVIGVLALAGCLGLEAVTPIPAGAQIVHVTVTPREVRLEPTTVHPGDVYLVLDAPADGSLVFVSSKHSETATPGPLTEAELARLAAGDTQGTMIDGMDSGGCSPEQDAQGRGMLGPCGNAMKATVLPGRYAVFGEDPSGDVATGRRPPMAILEVSP